MSGRSSETDMFMMPYFAKKRLRLIDLIDTDVSTSCLCLFPSSFLLVCGQLISSCVFKSVFALVPCGFLVCHKSWYFSLSLFLFLDCALHVFL